MENQHIPAPEERQLPEFNAMQKVKRRFFAMRNGDLAQQMAERGASYRINFGLNLPQISEIARDFLPGGVEAAELPERFDMADFARRLRDNTTTRESMLIAPMLFPVEQLSLQEAIQWCLSVPTAEVADILCMKLLRNHPDATVIIATLLDSAPAASADALADAIDNREPANDCLEPGDKLPGVVNDQLKRYCGLRLLLNLVQIGRYPNLEQAEAIALEEQRRQSPLTSTLIRQLLSEIAFLRE